MQHKQAKKTSTKKGFRLVVHTVGEDPRGEGRDAGNGASGDQYGVDYKGLKAQEDEAQLERNNLWRVMKLLKLPQRCLEAHDESPKPEGEGNGGDDEEVDVGVVWTHAHMYVPKEKEYICVCMRTYT